MPPLTTLLLLLGLFQPPAHYRYHAHDGTWVRRPHIYRRHPNTGTEWTGTCKDGALTFSHSRQGACSHHKGLQNWKGK